jgi:hypothetical protein
MDGKGSSIWAPQVVFCRICGTVIETVFQLYGGEVCNEICKIELEWRKTLCIMGKEYYPMPDSEKDKAQSRLHRR